MVVHNIILRRGKNEKRNSIYAAFLAPILAVNCLSGCQFSQSNNNTTKEQQTPVATSDEDVPIEKTSIKDTQIRTSALNFTIKHSDGKTVTLKDGKKISGELEIFDTSVSGGFDMPLELF